MSQSHPPPRDRTEGSSDSGRLPSIGLLLADDGWRSEIADGLSTVLADGWVPGRKTPPDQEADLLLIDEGYLGAHREAVAEKKRRASPADLPVLLVLGGQADTLESRFGGTEDERAFDVVDEVIDWPLDERRLELRIDSLLERRRPSREGAPSMQRGRDQFSQFLETVPNPLVIADAQTHNIVAANEQLASMLGTGAGAVEGTPVTSLHPPQQRSAYRKLFDQHIQAAQTGPTRFTSLPSGEQLLVHRADGTRVPVEISANLMEQGGREYVMGIFWDVTEEKARQATLQRRTARLRQAQHVADIGTWDIDTSTGTIHFSPAVRAMFGLEAEDSTGSFVDFLRLVHPKDRERVATQWREALEGGDYDVEFRVETVDGPTWVRSKAQVSFDEHGEPSGATGILQDISERKRREQVFKVSARYLRHNIRNQLTVVQGFAKQLASERESAADAERILENANSLLSMAEKQRLVQDITRVDRSPRQIDLGTILESVAETVNQQLPAASVSIEEPPQTTVREIPEIDRALVELLENAVSHVADPADPVELTVEPAADHVELTVGDHGSGIPETELEPLQAPSQTDHLNHASGIGLWLVKSIVDASGGTLRFSNREDGGAVVTIRLPRGSGAGVAGGAQ